MLQISNVYALRMAGVFMISLGTIWVHRPHEAVDRGRDLGLALMLLVMISFSLLGYANLPGLGVPDQRAHFLRSRQGEHVP